MCFFKWMLHQLVYTRPIIFGPGYKSLIQLSYNRLEGWGERGEGRYHPTWLAVWGWWSSGQFLTFIAVFKRFQSNTSIGRICIFSNGFKLSIKFYVFDTHIEFFYNNFFFFLFSTFCNFQAKQQMCLSIPFHIHQVKKWK